MTRQKWGLKLWELRGMGSSKKPLRLPLKDWQAEITGESEKVWVHFG